MSGFDDADDPVDRSGLRCWRRWANAPSAWIWWLEGPCYEAFTTRRPMLVPDLAHASAAAWPVFATEMVDSRIGAIFAFPLVTGAITIGASDLYRREPGWLNPAELATALEIVDIAAPALMGLADGIDTKWWTQLPAVREQVHQATRMLVAEFEISAEHRANYAVFIGEGEEQP